MTTSHQDVWFTGYSQLEDKEDRMELLVGQYKAAQAKELARNQRIIERLAPPVRRSSITNDPDALANRPKQAEQSRGDAIAETILECASLVLVAASVAAVAWVIYSNGFINFANAVMTFGGVFPVELCVRKF